MGWRLLVFLLVIGGLVFTGWYFTRPKPIAVALYTVETGPVEATVSNTRVGTVKACRRSMLAPAEGGEVGTLTVSEGDSVEKSQLLLEIWNEDLKAEVTYATAQKAAAEARTVEACSRAAGAERELKRLQKLVKDKLISEEKVDLAFTDAESKRAGCQAARATARVSEARIVVVRKAVERTIVRAPFAGVVAEVNTEIGEYVTPSPAGIPTLPAIELLDISCLYVSAPIDEVDAPPIEVGMRACVTLDAFPDRRRCNGTVRRIAPYVLDIQKQARTVEVEVELSDPQNLRGLLPGYSADIEIFLETRDNALRIPTQAVLEGYRVLLFDEASGVLVESEFEPGLSNWDFTEVASGLKEGDRIVLSVGREGVKAGARVTPEVSVGNAASP
ncbi:MAG: efflux RND transporter periplasmic adaptor subunit [Gammaproteobacteria bacterium]